MNKLLKIFLSDFHDFLKNNASIMIVCMISIITFQLIGKGELVINLVTVMLHVTGDVFMIMALTEFAKGDNKKASSYLCSASGFFILVGIIAVLQSNEGKNWQYLLGTVPFLIANTYQVMNAWGVKAKKYFNYKLTILFCIFLIIIYIELDLVYSYNWIQIIGYSLFPIALSLNDSPKIYLLRIASVILMLLGVLIDIYMQFLSPGEIHSAAISSFFITLIAFFGFKNNAKMYIEKVNSENKATLMLIKALS